MYLQGTAIWHPRCGPGPTENGTILNGSVSNGHHLNGDQKVERDLDGMSSTASETQVETQNLFTLHIFSFFAWFTLYFPTVPF